MQEIYQNDLSRKIRFSFKQDDILKREELRYLLIHSLGFYVQAQQLLSAASNVLFTEALLLYSVTAQLLVNNTALFLKYRMADGMPKG